MLTALPYRFYFEAIGLAGFRVPQKSRPVQALGMVSDEWNRTVRHHR
jgi:hypothetical protein